MAFLHASPVLQPRTIRTHRKPFQDGSLNRTFAGCRTRWSRGGSIRLVATIYLIFYKISGQPAISPTGRPVECKSCWQRAGNPTGEKQNLVKTNPAIEWQILLTTSYQSNQSYTSELQQNLVTTFNQSYWLYWCILRHPDKNRQLYLSWIS